MKNLNNSKGFSLIEVIVAFTIISVAFLTLSSSFPYGISINKAAADSTVAFYLAQEKIESLNASDYASAGIGTIETRHRLSEDTADFLYFYERETVITYLDENLAASESDTGMKKISVTVFFINASLKTERNYNITTILSQK